MFWQTEENNDFFSGTSRFSNASGIGDLVFILQYELISSPSKTLIVGSGPKIPTGSTSIHGSDGILLPQDLQPGTGAWDGLFFAYFTQNNILLNSNFKLIGNATYRLTSNADRFDGRQTYKFGNELQVNSGLSYRFLVRGLLLDTSLIIKYRNTQSDKTNNVETINTGGNWLYLFPGLTFNLTDKAGISISGELPLYRNLSGTQLTTSYKIKGTVNYILSTKKKINFNIDGI